MSPAAPAGGQTIARPSYLSVFSLVRDESPKFVQQIIWLKGSAREFGWKRVALGFSLTGIVDQWLEIYRIPQNSPMLDNLASLEQEPDYHLLLKLCRTRQMEFTRAMPYDPGLDGLPDPEQGHLLYSILELKTDHENPLTDHEKPLSEAMEQTRELFQSNKWSLVTASRSLTNPRQVVHLWQFEDVQTLYDLLEDKRYAAIDRCCERQSHRMLHVLGRNAIEAPTHLTA